MSAGEWVSQVRVAQRAAQDERWREAKRLADVFAARGALRVLLFGSVARGTAGPGSDIDLAVVTPAVRGRPLIGRGAEELLAAKPTVPVNLLVYTPEEWMEVSRRQFVLREMIGKGVDLL